MWAPSPPRGATRANWGQGLAGEAPSGLGNWVLELVWRPKPRCRPGQQREGRSWGLRRAPHRPEPRTRLGALFSSPGRLDGEAACGGFAERAFRVTRRAVLDLCKLCPARSPVPAASFAEGALRRWRARQLAGWAGRALPEGARGGLVVLRAANFTERGVPSRRRCPQPRLPGPFPAPGDSSPGRIGAFTFAFVGAAADSRRRDGDGSQLWPPDRRGNGNFGPRLRRRLFRPPPPSCLAFPRLLPPFPPSTVGGGPVPSG